MEADARADIPRADGKTAMSIALDGALVGIVAVADTKKDSTVQAVRELHAQRLRVIIATGDNERSAQAVAGKQSINEVSARVLSEAKKDLIDQLRREGHVIAMAGDGVNNALRVGCRRIQDRDVRRCRRGVAERGDHTAKRQSDGHQAGA